MSHNNFKELDIELNVATTSFLLLPPLLCLLLRRHVPLTSALLPLNFNGMHCALHSCTRTLFPPRPVFLPMGSALSSLWQTNHTYSSSSSSPRHHVFLAFGSNLGDRQGNIQRALLQLENPVLLPGTATSSTHPPALRILDSSFLYESLPMYYQDQSPFLNGVVVV